MDCFDFDFDIFQVTEVSTMSFDRFSSGEVNASLLSGLKQTVQVAQQGIAFTVAFLVIFAPVVVGMLITAPHWFHVLFAGVFPSQGFLNALVFFRPKYVSIRKRQDATGSRMGAICQTLDLAQPGFVSSVGTSFRRFIGRFSFARFSGGSSTGRFCQSACNS